MSSPSGARWKQWVLSWLIVLPLSVSMPWGLAALLEVANLQWPAWLFKVVVAGLISFNMVYWMLPLSARLTARWLLR
ncbi:hypothetical protein D3C87_473390 [compost metagenome]|jgi:antibiotic biosynthesis monooxygenase (ABM) superfamily enzyme|uniref:Uncharacterized protein n=1 Tax=Pseudomonas germanica TaxID=2815720 RepID=A0ABX8YX77_9PSED|nr:MULTISPECIES: hypothetical protein [Pseudomonas]QYY84636.1 hypothetical protein J0G10_14695 [Pseudomonas germanica]